jgi:exo-beta-1,3-glucanase (GH17 family)
MHKSVMTFLAVAIVIAGSWWWRGRAVPMPPAPLTAGEKLWCVSYAPFRGGQTPLDPTTIIPPAQIEEDLRNLAKLTDCIRIYSVDLGLDRVPEIAQRHGLQVLLGVWISSDAKRNQEQIRIGVELANRHRDTVRGFIVGNEVLLRGEMTAGSLEALVREVKSKVTVPVTYADVWEFWLRNEQMQAAVDFVTVHILPYWEDIPIPAGDAASHIASIRARVAKTFPGKDVIIGEAGWPSAGRMREGARPSLADQARVLHDLIAAAKTEGFRLNIIEAFDQPWKRHLEGTVGGYWGLETENRQEKFQWGQPVSNHPYWFWQALGGIFLAGLVLAAAYRARSSSATTIDHLVLAAFAIAGGTMAGAAFEAALLESRGAGGWARSLAWTTLAIATPIVAAVSFTKGLAPLSAAAVLGPAQQRVRDPFQAALAWLLIAAAITALESALGLTFNPRYLDFPYAALTATAAPLLILSLAADQRAGYRRATEILVAALIVLCAIKIAATEGLANWQALWLAAGLLALAITLARVRAATS